VPRRQKLQRRLNAIWHRMLYSCTHMATVGVIGIKLLHPIQKLPTPRRFNLKVGRSCRCSVCCGIIMCRYSPSTSASTCHHCRSLRSPLNDTSPSATRCAPRPCVRSAAPSESSLYCGSSGCSTVHRGSVSSPPGTHHPLDDQSARICDFLLVFI